MIDQTKNPFPFGLAAVSTRLGIEKGYGSAEMQMSNGRRRSLERRTVTGPTASTGTLQFNGEWSDSSGPRSSASPARTLVGSTKRDVVPLRCRGFGSTRALDQSLCAWKTDNVFVNTATIRASLARAAHVWVGVCLNRSGAGACQARCSNQPS
jgi:hypothetical protein